MSIAELGEKEIQRVAVRVRQAVRQYMGPGASSFLLTYADVLLVILRETWLGIRHELEQKENKASGK